MKALITIEEVTSMRNQWRRDLQSIALVPTMGALHDGHLSLIDEAKKYADKVIATIFVNPTQFGPNEDFAKYPRTLEDDMKALESRGVDAVFLPNAADIYPDDFQTMISNSKISLQLCGANRPGHFDGVLTVVMKLFQLTGANTACFGKKDYQQLKVIERMVKDLNLDIQIVGCELIRDSDGLALSSRNRYLSDEDRSTAKCLNEALKVVKQSYDSGVRSINELLAAGTKVLEGAPGAEVEYFEIRSQGNLADLSDCENLEVDSVVLVAAKVGETRLIDNIELSQ